MQINHIISDFKPEKSCHCITTSYKQVMHYYGIDISEEMNFTAKTAINIESISKQLNTFKIMAMMTS